MSTLVSHTQYTGRTPSVTLLGGATATDRVVIIIAQEGGDGAVVTAAAIGGNAATILGSAVNPGGIEVTVTALDMQNPGAGTYTTTITATNEFTIWDVYEFSGAAQIEKFTANAFGGTSTSAYDVTLASNSLAGERVIWVGAGADGVDSTSTITPNLTLTSSQILTSGTVNDLLVRSGFRTSASDNESLTFAYANFITTGGSVDRSTVVSLVLPDGVSPPTVTTTDTLEPGSNFTLTATNFASAPTSPVTMTDSGGNTATVAVTVTGSGPYTATGTFPARITTGTGTTLLRGAVTVELT